ncbi:MAG: hypothetical protein NTW21_10035 [Verrucomicrobia bacterium]|nr:hypothetical protein [Verrucomicrobiota bacterium]
MSPLPQPFFRCCARLGWLVLPLAAWPLARGGEAYFTGFENFAAGDDKIIGTDSWVGSHPGAKLHGVMSEAEHGVLGIGNAAFIGGFATSTTNPDTSTSKTVHIRRPVNLDPLALNEEVATFSVVFGIKDSSSASLIGGSNPARYKRDNFEFLIYNQTGYLLAGVQFDNTTLDTTVTPNLPRRLIYRVAWNASSAAFQYVLSAYTFLPETLETLQFMINYRTNLWTATLSDVPIFQDLPFYSGPQTKNLGSIMVKMGVTNSTYNPTTKVTTLLPGDNYLMFDDYTVRTDAVNTTLTVSKTCTGTPILTWNEDADYTYQVQYSSDYRTWQTDLAGASHQAALTGMATFADPTTPVAARRYYRVKRSYP